MAVSLLLVCVPARAHEPLWGETAQTFAFGIVHPAVRVGYQASSGPEERRATRQENVFSLQYSPRTTLNLRLDLPYSRVTHTQRINGSLRRSAASGFGDLTLSAKSRFRADFGPDWKRMHAYSVGIQLPTGESGGREPDGTLLMPSEQPGTGNWGLLLGYAFAYERLQDTVWASVMATRDVSGSRRRGDRVMLDLSYGYWLRPANRPQDLGIILAAGPHFEAMGRDRTPGARSPDSGYRTLGIQATLIGTKGQSQGRIGLLLPLTRRDNGIRTVESVQVRAGFEVLL